LWTTNLFRLLLIFWTGEKEGAHIALGVLHPVAGLITFCVGVGLMALLMKPFGLNRAAAAPAPRVMARTAANAAPRVFAVIGILLACAVALSVNNSSLTSYNLVASATGAPKVGSFLADPADPRGWTATFETEYSINKPLFGEDSRWFRYLYLPTSPASSSLHSSLPITADVIDAGSLTGFDEYGVTACYTFHGYTLRDISTVNLGDGVTGQALSYSGETAVQNWSIVYWILPVATGGGTRYERVILYLQNTSAGTVSLSPGTSGAAQLVESLKGVDPVQHRLLTNQAFLVAFARQVIAGQIHQDDTGVFIDSVQAPDVFSTTAAGQLEGNQSDTGTQAGPLSAAESHELFIQSLQDPHRPPQAQPPTNRTGSP
jgi:hypothetical protein